MKGQFAVLFFMLMPTMTMAAPVPYQLESEKSVVGFSWFFGRDEVKGTMPVADADLVLDFDNVARSRVAVSVDVTRAVAGFPFASQAMKGPKVLWADKFPRIVFTSRAVRPSGDGAIIDGDLTVRGITRPVTFTAQLYRQRGTEVGDRRRLSIIVSGTLSRAAFGADGWNNLAGDEVNLTIVARVRTAR